MSRDKYRRRKKAVEDGMPILLKMKAASRELYDRKTDINECKNRLLETLRDARLDTYREAAQHLRDAVENVETYLTAWRDVLDEWESLSAWERNYVSKIYDYGRQIGEAATEIGGRYAGVTDYEVKWGAVSAYTTVVDGARYPGRASSFRMRDATHHVVLEPVGLILLEDNQDIVAESAREGLPLLALYPGGDVVWAERYRAKAIREVRGVLAVCHIGPPHSKAVVYHKSVEGVGKKDPSLAKEDALEITKRWVLEKAKTVLYNLNRWREKEKTQRRAALVARLCKGVKATFADAKELSYCDPGIRSFQQRYNIGDEATLEELLATGDGMAAELALHITRKIIRQRREEKAKAKKEGSQSTEECRTCGSDYEPYGDGYDGECPSCADKRSEEESTEPTE